MKYSFILCAFLLFSCTTNITKLENRSPYSSKGFAFIYNDEDYNNKIIKGKLDNAELQISHSKLSNNTLLRIINPKTKDSITIKNFKKIQYPDFYKILITKKVSEELNLDLKLPLVEVIEIKKNKSFIAKKAKIFNEEKKISSNAPVMSVEISNISKEKKEKRDFKKDQFFILIGSFYREDTAIFLKQRINKEIPKFDTNKLKIIKKSNKNINLVSGPYDTINIMKNDYFELKKFGFEDLDISTNE